QAEQWRRQLVNFARRIGKPDPENYVDERGWVRRFGGAGLPNRFRGLETRPCGEAENALRVTLTRPIVWDALLQYLKPLGKVNIARSRPALGEVYLESHRPHEWQAAIVQGFEGDTSLRVTVIGAKDVERVQAYVRFQAIKYQTCLRCSACAAVCPQNAIVVSTEPDIYEVDETRDLNKQCSQAMSQALIEGVMTAPGEGMITPEFVAKVVRTVTPDWV
ncbi:MAG: hypothetical protein N2508_02955, partial [Anaerolineae bacterium]|nr:hypothetical protein [Anaerolineae bacterium]